jgi:hypothetical protein
MESLERRYPPLDEDAKLASWGFVELILETSAYHMPRAMQLMQRAGARESRLAA